MLIAINIIIIACLNVNTKLKQLLRIYKIMILIRIIKNNDSFSLSELIRLFLDP